MEETLVDEEVEEEDEVDSPLHLLHQGEEGVSVEQLESREKTGLPQLKE
jgi:hypothetical protein